MPKGGVGFHDWETWGGGQIPGWPQDVPTKFRWTGMRASISIERYLGIDPSEIKASTFHGAGPSEIRIEDAFHPSTICRSYGAGPDTVDAPYRAGRASPDEGVKLFLMCAHPGIDKDPVQVEIIGDEGIIKEEVFTDYQWKKVVIEWEELGGSKVLTFQVSRTWNPKLAGISEDSRDLGVAVAVLGH